MKIKNSRHLEDGWQFADVLNIEEINLIKDAELRSIRAKYWSMYHKIFMDEQRIPDHLFEEAHGKIVAEEKKELTAYIQRKKDRLKGK